MKGIILAGGTGKRLYPATLVVNKHLLCVYDRPMLFYPLHTLIGLGIKDIMIITGKEHCGDMIDLLGSGSDYNLSFTYRVQDEAGGIAQALFLVKDFVGKEHFVVILGDNLIDGELEVGNLKKGEAKVFLKEVDHPQAFGVAEIINGHIIDIAEKPKKPKTNLAVIGLYVYDYWVFSIIRNLKPSNRGELEITDVNNAYIQQGNLRHSILKGFWSDMGTPETLLKSSQYIKDKTK